MSMANKDGASSTSERQDTQRELVESGLRLPGVAEAMDVYGSAQRHSPSVSQAAPTLHYATGANS